MMTSREIILKFLSVLGITTMAGFSFGKAPELAKVPEKTSVAIKNLVGDGPFYFLIFRIPLSEHHYLNPNNANYYLHQEFEFAIDSTRVFSTEAEARTWIPVISGIQFHVIRADVQIKMAFQGYYIISRQEGESCYTILWNRLNTLPNACSERNIVRQSVESLRRYGAIGSRSIEVLKL